MRLLMQPKYFGPIRQAIATEKAIFDWMGRLCATYNGGYWEFYELSNGGFVMLIDSDKPIAVHWAENYIDLTMSLRSACITACLFAYVQLHEKTADDRFADLYQRLLQFAMECPESQLIRRVID